MTLNDEIMKCLEVRKHGDRMAAIYFSGMLEVALPLLSKKDRATIERVMQEHLRDWTAENERGVL
jgi:hypothetical protein